MSQLEARLADLKRKLKARENIKIYQKNCEAIRREIGVIEERLAPYRGTFK